jgi:hypothetical protein
MPRAGGEDEAEKTAPKPGEKQVEIAGVAVAAKGRESQGWMGGAWGQRSHGPSLFLLNQPCRLSGAPSPYSTN